MRLKLFALSSHGIAQDSLRCPSCTGGVSHLKCACEGEGYRTQCGHAETLETPYCAIGGIADIPLIGGSQKGGLQKGGFGGCSPGTKTGTRVRSPKPPFYETALLSPSELSPK